MNVEQFAGNNNVIVDSGDYEVTILIKKTRTKDNSKEYLNIVHKIRGDVKQPFADANTAVFDKAWPDKNNPEWFDLKKLGRILVTQKGLPGYHVEFENVDECVQFLNGCHCLVHVDKLYNSDRDEEENKVNTFSYAPSKWDIEHPNGTEEVKISESVSGNAAAAVLGDDLDNLPF